MRKLIVRATLGLFLGGLTSCVSGPVTDTEPETGADAAAVADTQQQSAVLLDLEARYANLQGWQTGSIMPAVTAFRRSCESWKNRAADAVISPRADYAGRVRDWLPICASLEPIADEVSARLIMTSLLTPVEILSSEGASRFTGYFEPEIEARRVPVWPFIQPIPGLPSDLVQVDGARVGLASGQRVPAQRLSNGKLQPYPPRKDIAVESDRVLGYAHPADVFFMQIQGSGRLKFEDGSVLRAAYAAHNGQPFQSTANWLLNTGRIERGEASMQGIRAWMDRAGFEEARLAMDQNPRFVFFQPVEIGDAGLGPVGAFNVPLTQLGSMAVDRSQHPLGVPMFVETTAPGLGGRWSGLLIAQDTGGAIKGPVRGDIYFGTGEEAGARAGTMNAPGRMWVLLPKNVAESLVTDRQS